MRKALLTIVAAALLTVAVNVSVRAHCEIPCGIYDDAMRYDMLAEHINTIEKSMTMITELTAEDDKNYNQIVRWVVNKEDHANQFMEIVGQYFLNQRIKPAAPDQGEAYDDYVAQLTTMHEMLVTAMKCKQTVDQNHVARLRELVSESRALYFEEHGHEH